jgi:hypothetical protein
MHAARAAVQPDWTHVWNVGEAGSQPRFVMHWRSVVARARASASPRSRHFLTQAVGTPLTVQGGTQARSFGQSRSSLHVSTTWTTGRHVPDAQYSSTAHLPQ